MPNRIVDVVDALNARVASGEDFFVTVMDDRGGTGTFARDNGCYGRDRLAFVIRRFEADRCPLDGRLPMMTVCGMFATSEHLELKPAHDCHNSLTSALSMRVMSCRCWISELGGKLDRWRLIIDVTLSEFNVTI